jgi:hypothetical protein
VDRIAEHAKQIELHFLSGYYLRGRQRQPHIVQRFFTPATTCAV